MFAETLIIILLNNTSYFRKKSERFLSACFSDMFASLGKSHPDNFTLFIVIFTFWFVENISGENV